MQDLYVVGLVRYAPINPMQSQIDQPLRSAGFVAAHLPLNPALALIGDRYLEYLARDGGTALRDDRMPGSYAALPPSESLWKLVRRIRKETGTYATAYPVECDTATELFTGINATLPELMAHAGRVQRTGLFAREWRERGGALLVDISRAHTRDAIHDAWTIDCFFPLQEEVRRGLSYSARHGKLGMAQEALASAEKRF